MAIRSFISRAIAYVGSALLALIIGAPAFAGVILFQDNFDRPNSGDVDAGVSPGIVWAETEVGSNDVSVNNNTLRLRNAGAQAAQLSLSTQGFENITVSYDFIGLNSDVLDILEVAFSIGGGFLPANTHTLENTATYTSIVWSIAAADAALFQLRFLSNPDGSSPGGVTLEGARIDNVVVMGDPISIPEPGILALFGLGFAGLCFARRRQLA